VARRGRNPLVNIGMSDKDGSVDEDHLEADEPVTLRQATEDDAVRLFTEAVANVPYTSMTVGHLYALASQEGIEVDSPILPPVVEALRYELRRRNPQRHMIASERDLPTSHERTRTEKATTRAKRSVNGCPEGNR